MPAARRPRSASPTAKRASGGWWLGWRRWANRTGSRWPSSARMVAWWTASWRPATPWSRSPRTPSRPGGKARWSREPSPIPATPRSSPSTCGCEHTGSRSWSRSVRRPGPCGRWSGPGTTWSASGCASTTSWKPAWTPSGPEPRSCSPTSPATSPWRSWSATPLRGWLRAAPDGIGEGPEAEARRDAVLGYVGVVRALNASIKALTRSVAAHLGEHPDSEIFTSLPRSGQVNAAQLLAEWGDCREAYDGPEAIAARAGAAPVTKRSGKHKAVSFRWACNTRFRWAITTFADNSRHESPWAAAIYQAAIDRGCDHPHAVRILARAWIRVIYRCWVDRTPYDAARHGGAKRLELGRKEVA